MVMVVNKRVRVWQLYSRGCATTRHPGAGPWWPVTVSVLAGPLAMLQLASPLLLLLLLLATASWALFPCPGPGTWPDPASCTAFYQCLVAPHRVHKYLCPPGTR